MQTDAGHDFTLLHGWGGVYVCPKTDTARDWCRDNLHCGGPFGGLANMDADGDYCVDHRDATDIARAIKDDGLTFAGMDCLP